MGDARMIPNLALLRTLMFVAPIALSLGYAWFTKQSASQALSVVAQQGGTIASLKRDIELREAREKALRWRLQVRDDAIEQSKCKLTLQDWVKNPDKIPKKFKPFDGDMRPEFAK